MSGCNRELWRRLGHNEGERFLRTAMSSARKSRPDKTASKLVSLHLPGAGLRQLPAGDAVNMASGWLQQGNLPAVIQVMQAPILKHPSPLLCQRGEKPWSPLGYVLNYQRNT